jgi:hypothetical protein
VQRRLFGCRAVSCRVSAHCVLTRLAPTSMRCRTGGELAVAKPRFPAITHPTPEAQ